MSEKEIFHPDHPEFDKFIDALADKVADKLESRVYVTVGRTVIQKGIALLGLGAVSVAFLYQNKIPPFNK